MEDLRDKIALEMLKILLNGKWVFEGDPLKIPDGCQTLAEHSYAMADAMINERNRKD